MHELWHVIGCESLVGGICNCAPKDLHEECRAQLQTLRGERDHWHAHYDAAMFSWDQTAQEKAALEAQLAASQGALSKITAEKQALWIETDRQLRELIDERAASQERERALADLLAEFKADHDVDAWDERHDCACSLCHKLAALAASAPKG